MLRFALIGLFAVCASACNQQWPNGTDVAYTWWPSCGGPVTYYSAKITDVNVKLTQPIIITVDADNEGRSYTAPNLRVTINIWSWGGIGSCKWSPIPTLGLLSDLDACAEGIPCPVKMGRQTLPMTLDFTKFDAIIKLLKDDQPYQLEMQLSDKLSGDKTCVMAQSRCKTK